MSNIMGHLRYVAGYRADDRRVAEFGPAGGNPDANAKDHIEWRAADEIERLRDENQRLLELARASALLRKRLGDIAVNVDILGFDAINQWNMAYDAVRELVEVDDED